MVLMMGASRSTSSEGTGSQESVGGGAYRAGMDKHPRNLCQCISHALRTVKRVEVSAGRECGTRAARRDRRLVRIWRMRRLLSAVGFVAAAGVPLLVLGGWIMLAYGHSPSPPTVAEAWGWLVSRREMMAEGDLLAIPAGILLAGYFTLLLRESAPGPIRKSVLRAEWLMVVLLYIGMVLALLVAVPGRAGWSLLAPLSVVLIPIYAFLAFWLESTDEHRLLLESKARRRGGMAVVAATALSRELSSRLGAPDWLRPRRAPGLALWGIASCVFIALRSFEASLFFLCGVGGLWNWCRWLWLSWLSAWLSILVWSPLLFGIAFLRQAVDATDRLTAWCLTMIPVMSLIVAASGAVWFRALDGYSALALIALILDLVFPGVLIWILGGTLAGTMIERAYAQCVSRDAALVVLMLGALRRTSLKVTTTQ